MLEIVFITSSARMLAYRYINSIDGIGVIKMYLSSIVEFK